MNASLNHIKFLNFTLFVLIAVGIAALIWSILTPVKLPDTKVLSNTTDFSTPLQSTLAQKFSLAMPSSKNIKKIEGPVNKMHNITLKAIYKKGAKRFIMITDQEKYLFLQNGEHYKDFELYKIEHKSAVFYKDGKYYKVALKELSAEEKLKKHKKQTKKSQPKQDQIQHKTQIPKLLPPDIDIYPPGHGEPHE